MTEAMRVIDIHHDGHGLNESIIITSDPPDVEKGGGAAHAYEAVMGNNTVLSVQFQHGPRAEADSTPGITEAVLLAILIDRLRCFQAGPFACRENAIQLTKLEETLLWTKERANARAKRGVLGKNIK